MSELVSVAVDWAATANVPNWMFVAALLTRPSTWTRKIVAAVEKRLGGGE